MFTFSTLRTVLLVALIQSLSTIALSQHPDWASTFGSLSQDFTTPSSMSMDAENSVYLSSSNQAQLMYLNGGNIDTILGGPDLGWHWVAKFDSTGIPQWGWKWVPGIDAFEIKSQASQAGNLYVVGNFSEANDFDPSSGVTMLSDVNTTTRQIYLSKFDKTGDFVWAKQLENSLNLDPAPGYCHFGDMVLDSDENIYISGVVSDSIDFDPSSSQFVIEASVADPRIFLAKYDSSGALQWAHGFRDSAELNVQNSRPALDIDANGNLIFSGTLTGSTDFDPSSGTAILQAQGFETFFVRFNQNGDYVSGFLLDVFSSSIKPDYDGNFYTMGRFTDSVDFDPSGGATWLYALELPTDPFKPDMFVAKYGANGQFLWAFDIGADYAFDGVPTSMIVDRDGKFWFTGSTGDSADIDPSSNVEMVDGAFTAQYDPNGLFLRQVLPGQGTNPLGLTVVDGVYDPANRLHALGSVGVGADLDYLTDSALFPGALFGNNSDFFLARYEAENGIVAVEEPTSLEGSIGLFPNPTQDVVTLQLPLSGNEKTAVSVMNTKGIVLAVPVSAGSKTNQRILDVRNVKSGVYFVLVQAGEERYTSRLVVQH